MTSSDYLQQMQALLPPGPAWPTEEGAGLSRFLAGLAEEFARLDARGWQLLEEADPRTAIELFNDWERVAGLPDTCAEAFSTTEQTLDQRRQALIARLVTVGGQTQAYFIALAAAFGVTITITEYRAQTVDDDVSMPMFDDAWNTVWSINMPLTDITYADVNSSVDEPLASWGNPALECVLRRIAPAHLTLFFSYT